MNTTTQQIVSYVPTSQDRMGLTLFVALAMHALVILGISFDLEDDSISQSITSMEITLVHHHSEQKPEDADYLAQANQLGGGNAQTKTRPTSPFSNPTPTPDDGFAPESRPAITPPPHKNRPLQQEILSVTQAPLKTESKLQKDAFVEQSNTLTAAHLFEKSRKIARLIAEINHPTQAYQQRPRHTNITGANAQEYRFASYLDSWRAKVERIGNLNYPDTAIRQKLSGNLLLDVAINPDGSLHSIRLVRSSGHRILDEAAERIVRLAAPYPPLTKDILEDTEVLHIPRVWQFKSGSGLRTSVN